MIKSKLMTTVAAKARYTRYRQSPKGKVMLARYAKSPQGIRNRVAYEQRPGIREKRNARRSYHVARFGIPFSARAGILASQNSRCAACEIADPGSRLGWHLHHTGSKKAGTLKVHGFLCHHCNVAAGQGMLYDIERLELLAVKLREWL